MDLVKSNKTKTPSKSASTKKKEKFDTSAFVFETPIELIEEALEKLEEQENDPLAEPLTKDQLYWWSHWCMMLPEAKRRGMKTVPTCAIENAVLKLSKPKQSNRKKK